MFMFFGSTGSIYLYVCLFGSTVLHVLQPVSFPSYRTCVCMRIIVFVCQDLLSVLIDGPVGTPYEDCVFLFDVCLPQDYPLSPPLLHYLSFSGDRLNPNLYVDGKVCVSLLGTWYGKVMWQGTPETMLYLA